LRKVYHSGLFRRLEKFSLTCAEQKA